MSPAATPPPPGCRGQPGAVDGQSRAPDEDGSVSPGSVEKRSGLTGSIGGGSCRARRPERASRQRPPGRAGAEAAYPGQPADARRRIPPAEPGARRRGPSPAEAEAPARRQGPPAATARHRAPPAAAEAGAEGHRGHTAAGAAEARWGHAVAGARPARAAEAACAGVRPARTAAEAACEGVEDSYRSKISKIPARVQALDRSPPTTRASSRSRSRSMRRMTT